MGRMGRRGDWEEDERTQSVYRLETQSESEVIKELLTTPKGRLAEKRNAYRLLAQSRPHFRGFITTLSKSDKEDIYGTRRNRRG